MKKLILAAAVMLSLSPFSSAGEISVGAVPRSINYQGRLERDNAPISGTIHLYFRVYNSLTATGGACGAVSQPCLWESPELVVQAAQGIFSANLAFTDAELLKAFSGSQQLYLEVQVESDILSPREPLSSVAYALVAKKLEDGASVTLSSLTAAYQVLLATAPGSNVGIGTNSPSNKLTVNGSVELLTGGSIIFPNGSVMTAAGIGSASNISAFDDATIVSDANNNAVGDMIFSNPAREQARILNNGDMGVGTPAPMGRLDVNGSLYVGNEGIYDRVDGEVNIKADLLVEGGKITGMGSESLSLGEFADIISLVSGGSERMRVHSNGFVGIGLVGPTANLHTAGDIRANAGVRGGLVSIGTYAGDWTAGSNEIRAQANTHLLLQQTNSYNVGIGTDTPREKLHVRGSVRSDYGIIAATAAFSGDVSLGGNTAVNGNFSANGNNKTVSLSSTTIYGTLHVTGGIGSLAGMPAYLVSTQTFSGQNTFVNQVTVSSDVICSSRVGAGVIDFDFAGPKYLQVGDNKAEFANDDALAYLVGGSGTGNAKLNFYRGASEAARFETQSDLNLALVVNGQTKTLTDSVYHRIQNSVVWISTGYAGTPAIYVSSLAGNVGIGTAVADPTYKLTVNGSMRIAGPTSNGIVFADGSSMNSAATIGAAMSLSNSGDALVWANTGGGGGSVILRSNSVDGLTVDSGGNVGIGTLNPVSKLNVRGGDLVLGTPVNPYSANGIEDLVVGGNIVFDGALVQRSVSAVQLSNLIVAGDVYLSTGTSKKTGIGTSAPAATLDVNGNAQFGQGATKSTFTATGALQLASVLSSAYGGTGANLNAAATGAVPYFSAAGVMSGLAAGTANFLLQANGPGAAPTWIQSLDTSSPNTIVRREGTGSFSGNTITATSFSGPLTGNVTGNVSGTAATVTGAAQANITSVGTLTGLTMGGNIAMGLNSITGATAVTATTFNGALNGNASGTAATVTGAAQANITSVGTLTGLTMGGNIAMGANSITGATAVTATTFNGALNGNANTATSLAADGADCSAGNAPLGVGATGASVGCFDVTTQAEMNTHTGDTAGPHGAVSANSFSRIVTRDVGGNFSATTITAALSGNASTATNLAANGSNCSAGSYPLGVDAAGNVETCTSLGTATVNRAVCWKSATALGYCSTIVAADGSCTCN